MPRLASIFPLFFGLSLVSVCLGLFSSGEEQDASVNRRRKGDALSEHSVAERQQTIGIGKVSLIQRKGRGQSVLDFNILFCL